MSRQTQEFKQRLTELKDLSPEDWIVLPGVRISLGTAPQFAVPGAPWNRYFAEYVTGVPNLYFAREVVLEQGRLRFFHQHFMRDSAPEEMRRVHIIAPDETGAYRPRRYLAYERRPGLFQLLALSGSPPPPSGDALLTRDQLRPLETEIFFPKPFEHGNPEHLKY